MRLNLDYYYKECEFELRPNEDKVIEYINTNTEDFESIVKKDLSDEVMLGLSNIRKNLVYAYDFKPNSVVLEIGAHLGEITGALCEKCEKVISIELNKKRAEAIAKRHEDKNNLEIIVRKEEKSKESKENNKNFFDVKVENVENNEDIRKILEK